MQDEGRAVLGIVICIRDNPRSRRRDAGVAGDVRELSETDRKTEKFTDLSGIMK